MNINYAKELVVKAGNRLVESGLIARTWGNVSCRISENEFVITPSGRDYVSLTPEEIVAVNIWDCSYNGNIKPSSEKGIHAEVYRLFPNANFVIHTHQENASVISACGIEAMEVGINFPYLGGKVICASYALPGTKKLRKNVAAALSQSKGRAVIMKNHGALCFGRDYDEAFKVASELEKACLDYITSRYQSLSQRDRFDMDEMNRFALSRLSKTADIPKIKNNPLYNGRRTDNGFVLYKEAGDEIQVQTDRIEAAMPREAAIYNAVFSRYKDINYIINFTTPEIKALSDTNLELRPLLDDFAQIAGTRAKNVEFDISSILHSLKNSSLVLIRNNGALCCGRTLDDAAAVAMVAQKASRALIGAALFGKIVPINSLECILMHYIYSNKYSKLKYVKP